MTRVLLWLPLALLVAACLAMNLAALRRRRRHRGAKREERLATDTDVRAVLQLTPLPAPSRVYRRPAQVPHIAGDIPEQCWCGKPRWHLPDYVITALHHPTVAETMDADSMTFPAVTAPTQADVSRWISKLGPAS